MVSGSGTNEDKYGINMRTWCREHEEQVQNHLLSFRGAREAQASLRASEKQPAVSDKQPIASGDQFIAGKEKKDFIKNTFGAVCCEMEGASIAQTCYSSGVPFAVLRTVSDKADGSSHVTYSEFLPAAADLAAKTIMNFCEG